MKRADAGRVAILVEALGDLDRCEKAKPKDPDGECWRGVQLSIEDFEGEAGSSSVAHAELPHDLGPKLISFARKLIEGELAALGVEP